MKIEIPKAIGIMLIAEFERMIEKGDDFGMVDVFGYTINLRIEVPEGLLKGD